VRSPALASHLAGHGARFQGADTRAAVLSFGDVPGEYRAGREGALLLDATARGCVIATGKDRADFLHRILANDVRGLAPGEGNCNLLLSPKGKVVEAFDLGVATDSIRLDACEQRGAALRTAVDMYLFSEKVALVDASATVAALELCGPHADDIVRTVSGLDVPQTLGHWREANGVRAARALVAGSLGLRIDAGPERALELWTALEGAGARPGGLVADDCLRAEAAHARFLVDVDDNVYPQEARLERAFSLTKGCYTGQEVVAKIDTYGGINKRLVTVVFDTDEPVARGTRLLAPDDDGSPRDLGVVTTWGYSFQLDRPIGLAYLKRRHQGIGRSFELSTGDGNATVVASPVRSDGASVTGEFE
jgi:folate-binding protein YgfZ